ncbi:Sapep family Mn(2+)-dependent dipeptidase [Atopobium fossor]|uniref:Sapep family Mn(2+)-dependent dipeptidase n=1 Tax=Atopobium fossor TaxID=39487 RepID=UPI000401D2C6|nr:Sapep family Mn(2+)-dependent dipeptidase [Atopobium fossor]
MADDLLKARVDAYVDEVWDSVVSDIDTLVQIESVEDLEHASDDAPFGPAPRAALDAALRIAERLGLDAVNCNGYLGYGQIDGQDDKQIATIAHADIVPLGTGWDFDPLRVTRKDGYLIGRGVADDKGPLVLSLYAAGFVRREVLRTGIAPKHTLRALVGTNEETSMGDVEWYLQNYREPDFLFTPDAEFPLICGEKGRVQGAFRSQEIAGEKSGNVLVSLDGGTVANAVCSLVEAVVYANLADLPAAQHIELEDAGNGKVRIVAHGKGGHASMPEGTLNAIGILVDYLLAHKLYSPSQLSYLELLQKIMASTDGSSIGIDATDSFFEPLTCIGGTLRTNNGCFVQTIDVRYPTSTDVDKMSAVLEPLAVQHNASFEVQGNMTPFLTDPESPEIQTLVSTYNEYTGKNGRAFTIGGGTYARHFGKAAAFGPFEHGATLPKWVGPEHGPNEGVHEEEFKQALKIYIVAIMRLMELNLD